MKSKGEKDALVKGIMESIAVPVASAGLVAPAARFAHAIIAWAAREHSGLERTLAGLNLNSVSVVIYNLLSEKPRVSLITVVNGKEIVELAHVDLKVVDQLLS